MKRIVIFLTTMFLSAVSVIAQIEGVVTDRSSKAVQNVTVTATDMIGNVPTTVMSDAQGYYSFNGLQPGKYKIVAKAAGFRTAVFKNIILKEGDTGAVEGEEDLYKGVRLDIVLSTDMVRYQIEGQVIDQKEKGQPNITVTATDANKKVVATVKSDASGFYGIKGLQPGKYKIEVKAAGFLPAIYNVVMKETEPGPKGEEDMDEATWLYVVLRPVKKS